MATKQIISRLLKLKYGSIAAIIAVIRVIEESEALTAT